MARTRLLKPGFFMNEELARHSFAHRLVYAGLWTLADREGRLVDRPQRIKAELFPYDNEPPCPHCHGRGFDIDQVLADLQRGEFVSRYVTAGQPVLMIPKFLLHQKPHPHEAQSELPAPPEPPKNRPKNARSRQRVPKATHVVLDPVPISISDPVPDPVRGAAEVADVGNGRGHYPIFKGARLVVFAWMREELCRLLGAHAEAFDLLAWFYQLDAESAALILPGDRDARWAWLQSVTVEEAQRRGLPIAHATPANGVTDDATWAALVKSGPERR